ncbi:hypothetical protein [Prosthecobacter sp.]|uniref:hypothetical protein n=1 Tax=Prosthecobacter sp. TaxID=1965333 RepID=UPI002AB93FD2|nr:hypothetical protein [Prosthecobacter sp.]MDZ4405708.1 hypothetical protein [Prosthecobacter sp.]
MPPSSQDLAEISSHIRYEIEMAFIIPKHNPKDGHIRESVFLSMLIHARILLHFFESADRRQDDVLCSDFGFPTRAVNLAPEHRKRFNKDMMHLTYSRLRHTSETKPWPLQDIMQPLLLRSLEFIEFVISHPPTHMKAEELYQWKLLMKTFNKE